MNLKITSSVSLSIGGSAVTNVVGSITQHATGNAQTGGLTVPCDLNWWINASAMTDRKDQIWPQVNAINIASTTFELTEQEAMAANLPLTFYQKAAAKLASDYGWTVVVEQ